MNSVQLIGNLTRDPEVRYTTGDNPMAICRFGIAVNEGYGDKKTTNFLNIVVFGKSGENCEKHLKKGSKVAVNGKIKTGSYEKDGQRVNTFDIVADNYGGVEFLSNDKSIGNDENSSLAATQSLTQGAEPTSEPSGFSKLNDNDIPF